MNELATTRSRLPGSRYLTGQDARDLAAPSYLPSRTGDRLPTRLLGYKDTR